MKMYRFKQACGGQGTTTIALTVALLCADRRKKVLYLTNHRRLPEIGAVVWDGSGVSPVAKVARQGGGVLTLMTGIVMVAGVSYPEHLEGYDYVVLDSGVTVSDGYQQQMANRGDPMIDTWCVMGPGYGEIDKLDYMLRQGEGAHRVLVTVQPGRRLTAQDVAVTVGVRCGEVVQLPWDPAVFTNVDTGLHRGEGLWHGIVRTHWAGVLGKLYAWEGVDAAGVVS